MTGISMKALWKRVYISLTLQPVESDVTWKEVFTVTDGKHE
jgi:hypothetical protein